MHGSGFEEIFIGEPGTATWLLLVLVLSLACLARGAGRRSGDGAGPRLVAGLAMMLAAAAARATGYQPSPEIVAMAASALSAAGLYLVILAFGMAESAEAGPSRGRPRSSWGLVTGAAGAITLLLTLSEDLPGAAAVGIAAAFFAFVPLGIAASAFAGRPGGRAGVNLTAACGKAILAVAVSAGAIASPALLGGGPFQEQLVSLLYTAGLVLLLAGYPAGRAGVDRALARERRGEGADGGGSGLPLGPGEDEAGIAEMLSGGAGEDEIYREIAARVSRNAPADFAVVRVAREGDDRLEMRGFASDGRAVAPPPFARNLSGSLLLELRGGEAGGTVMSLDPACLGDDRDAFVPAGMARDEGSIAVAPVTGDGRLYGAVIAGFFSEGPDDAASRTIERHSLELLQVAERESTKRRLLTSEKELVLCREELQSVSRLKSNFLSVVSHELRTPLTSIKAYSETLSDNIESINRDTIRDFLRVMGEENDRVIKLVDNMLDYSCMENGHLKVEKAACDLGALIEEIHSDLERTLIAGRIDSEVKLPRTPLVIEADGELIRQLIQNLVSNAVKFTPEGGTVRVTLEEEASAARITVEDTGRGIPEDQLEKVFERFHQVDASDTREHGGSGLGLAICKNIVEWHDGRIWVENVKEAGAKFVVMLPMKDIVVRHSVSSGYIGSVRFERERYLNLLVEMLSEFLQARKASIMMIDEDQEALKIVAAKGLDPEFVQNTRVEIGERIAGKVFLEEQEMLVFDIERDSNVARTNNTRYYGTKSFISAPLRDGDEVIGVLNVSDHVENREFTDTDAEILDSLGIVIAGMLKKLEAYETVSANFDKLKSAMKSILHMREQWGSRNLVNYTMIAMAVGRRLDLEEKSLAALRLGMNVYDLGMMKIPRAIRIKKEELGEDEWEKLREHPYLGYALASPMALDPMVMRMIRSHHENYDGSGYPDGLAREEIPVGARIINVVDSFRALITPGPYRRCYSLDEARNEIIRGAGTRFDPKVVGAFVKALHELGAEEDRGELVLAGFERRLEERRKTRDEETVMVKEEI